VVAASNAKLIAEVERIVLTRVAAGRLVLPSLPVVATKCLQILRDPDFQHRKLVTQIETEPVLAATIVRAANTAAHGGTTVKGLDQAVTRVGAQRLKSVIVEYASRELFQSTDRRIAEASRKIWDHSVAVAYLSRDIAAFAGHEDGDACYLAGLLHDIGKPVVAAMLLEAERKLARDTPSWLDFSVWTQTIESVHRKVGVALSNEWKLPEEIGAAIRDCNDYDPGNRKAAANIVRLANAVAKREGYTTGPIDADDIDAMIMVGRSMLGADDDVITRLASGLRDRIGGSA
jgi:putative nucleotidyltransferase with HDIG domain